ncbi:MAG: zinc-binding dehydrogenase, partial [Candidatus Thermoplasmatota archaeon]
TNGKGVDYAFEAVGKRETMEQAYLSASNSGLVSLVGNPKPNEKIQIDALPTHYGKRLIGGHGGSIVPERDFLRYADLYSARKLKLDELITDRFPLERINDALEALEKGKVLGRAIIEF